MDYATWLRELAVIVGYDNPDDLDHDYPQLRPLLYDARMSPREAADALASSM